MPISSPGLRLMTTTCENFAVYKTFRKLALSLESCSIFWTKPFICLVFLYDCDRTVGQQCGHSPDCGQGRCHDCAYRSDSYWNFDHALAFFVFDDNAADVALMDKLLDPLFELRTRDLKLFLM